MIIIKMRYIIILDHRSVHGIKKHVVEQVIFGIINLEIEPNPWLDKLSS